MSFFDLFKKKTSNNATNVKPVAPIKPAKTKAVSQEIDRCARCKNTIPAQRLNAGILNEKISWQIKEKILYISGKGSLTKDDYLTITAPAPRYSTITYDRVLPWAVCPGIRETKYIGEGCPVNNIPNHIKKIVVIGEISGLKDFLLNSNDWIGVKLQSAKEYFDQ